MPTSRRPPAKRAGTATSGPRRPATNRPRTAPTASKRALGRVDGPRGQRDGRAVEVARQRRQRLLKRLGLGAAAVLLLVAVVLVAGSPLRNVRDQQAENAAAAAELAELEAEEAELMRQIAELRDEAEIERKAREELGLVRPGEEAFSYVPDPVDPAGLPPTWPFTGVEQALGSG